MPVLVPVSVLLGSLGGLVYVIKRRLNIHGNTLELQKELEGHQKKLRRARKKKTREKEKMLMDLKRASDMKHKSLRNLGSINELMKRADHLISSGDKSQAITTLIQILSLDENHRKANELIARLYLESGQNKRAELIYKNLIEHYPFAPPYYAQLGHSYFQRRQFKAATACYEKALDLDKNNPERYYNLGKVYAKRKDYHGALGYYTQAHRLNVRDIELMFLIVETCLQNTDAITAREYLHKILDYEPYNQQAKTLLGEVLRTLKEE